MKRANIIIALEGIDGAGKSTIIALLKKEYGEKISVYSRTQKGNFLDSFLSTSFMQKNYWIQAPIYLLLSYINYLRLGRVPPNNVIIMDRCFLSNICYFFPKALKNVQLYKFLCFFEIKLMPRCIFIIDVDPRIGRVRDQNKKTLEWLIETKQHYRQAKTAITLKQYKIQIIEKDFELTQKVKIVNEYLKGEFCNGYR